MEDFQEDTRFLLYWISLEVLASGQAGAIRALLAKAYGQREIWVDEHLRFKEIRQMRRDLLHGGASIRMLTFHERLMQLFFWDMVNHQIGLPSQGLAQLLVQTGLIDEELNRKT